VEEDIFFYGHPNIRATHERTIELTKAKEITLRGDCIVGVKASKACLDLSDTLKQRLRDEFTFVNMSLIVGGYIYDFNGNGSSSLILDNREDIVIRKSAFVCPRTMAIRSNNASSDIPRHIVKLLREPDTKAFLRINIE